MCEWIGRWHAQALLLALLLALPIAQPGSASPSGLDELLEGYIVQLRQSRGLVAARVEAGRVEIASAGEAGPPGAPKLSETTLFEIGSVTKVFTALLLGDMASRGEVALEATIAELMPERYALDEALASITLRELATHRSGLPRMFLSGPMLRRTLLRFSDPYAGSTKHELFEAAAALEGEDLEPRGEFHYSNLGVALLGRLLEEAAGEPYEGLLEERILSRYRMSATRPTGEALAAPELAAGHRSNLRPVGNWRLDAYTPAGGLVSSVSDLLGFLRRAMAGHAPQGGGPAPAGLNGVAAGAAGLGWMVERFEDEPLYWHNGRTAGYYAFVGFLPESDRGLVLLSNTGHDGDGLALALLRDEPRMPDPAEEQLLWDAFMLLLTALVPFAALGQRWSMAGSAHGGTLRPRGRIHLAHGAAGIATMLLITRVLGPWHWVPGMLWWAALGLALALLASAVPSAARLGWFPGAGGRHRVLPVLGIAVNAAFIVWFAANS